MNNEEFLAKGEKVLYTKKLSIFRILTNTNANVILLVAFIILCFQYMLPNFLNYLFPLIVLQAGLLVVIIIITVYDYKTSCFFVTDKRLIYIVSSQGQRKWLDLEYNQIADVYTSNYNIIVVTNDNKKHKLETLSKPNLVAEEINKAKKKSN